MAHSLEVESLFGAFCMCAHSACAETAGLQHADREDAAQDACLALCRRLRASGDLAAIEAMAPVFGGVLRNAVRNADRRRGVHARVQQVSAQELDAFPAPEAALPQDCRERLTPDQRTWLAGFENLGSDVDLATLWGVHIATVSRRRSWLRRLLTDVVDRKPTEGDD